MAIDPVCGMTVQEDAAKGVSEYKGQSYYFCSPVCKKKFDADPEKYLNRMNDPMPRACPPGVQAAHYTRVGALYRGVRHGRGG